jgi:cystathionine beta-synthase
MFKNTQKRIYDSIAQLVGCTPIVKLNASLRDVPTGQWLRKKGFKAPHFNLESQVFAKIEFLNPGGSVKDRIALSIIEGAERAGLLKAGGTIVEATSGNTGAGLAMIAATKGYKCIFVMPDKMSAEKINALRAYGAKVVISPLVEPEHELYYCNVAKKIAQETPNCFLANQYFNPDNPRAHFETTGPEIWEQFEGDLDFYMAGMGTGGTFSGTAKFLKSQKSSLKCIGIDPVGSIYYGLATEKKPSEVRPYLVEGVGEDMMPGTMDLSLVDGAVYVNDEEAFAATQILARKEGILVGGSCGMAFFGALQYLAWHESQGGKPGKALVILPDSGSRYLSKVFNDVWLKQQGLALHWGSQVLKSTAIEYLPQARRIEGVE